MKYRLLAAVLAATTSWGHAAMAQEADTFRFGWPAALSVTLSHVTFGEQLGFFEDENIELEIATFQGSFPVLQQILAGGLETGYVGLEAPVIAQQEGNEALPARYFYKYTSTTIWEFAVPADSDIQELADLEGRTIGVGGLAWGNIPLTRAWLQTAGVDEGDYEFLPVTTGPAAFRALTSGEVDVLNLFDTQHAALESTGVEIRRLALPEQFASIPSHGFPATETMLTENSDLLDRFGRAWSKSILACNANPSACLQSFWDAYPDLAPRPDEVEERRPGTEGILMARLSKITPSDDGSVPFGAFEDEDWRMVIESLNLGGQAPNTDIPYDTLSTNALVPGMNDFDAEAVIAAARATE